MAEGFTCEVDEEYRSACEGLDSYGEHEGKRYCVLHFPGEEKKDDFRRVLESKLAQKDYDFGGTIFPEGTSDFGGRELNANANFNGATFVGDADFRGAQFSGKETDFREAKFSGERTNFSRAKFNGEKATDFIGAKFSGEQISFSGAKFSGERTNFSGAQFAGERIAFSGAQFDSAETYFLDAKFNGEKEIDFSVVHFSSARTSFLGARFSGAETFFRGTTFMKEVDFSAATFKEKASFWGSKANPVFGSGAWAQFRGARIEKPEMLTFNTVLLHPGWFINADVRKVDFTDVEWYGMPGGPAGTLEEEIKEIERREVESPHTLLAQACRRLSANAEENREYPLANEFHYWSMDAVRKGSWNHFKDLNLRALLKKETWHDIGEHFGLITTLYWALSGYGVRATRAFWILFAIWLMFAALYLLLVTSSPFSVFAASDIWQGIDYARQAAVYSLSALVRLNPRSQSEDLNWFQTLVTIEGILGPLQIALLVLAVRRKVMR